MNPYLLIIVTVLLSAFPLRAEQTIEQICQKDSQQCLAQITKAELSVQPGSFKWFSLKLHKISALFQLIKTEELKAELDVISGYETLPQRLKLRVLILYTKVYSYYDKQALVKQYQAQVEKMMAGYDYDTTSPYIAIEYANFQLYLQKYQKGVAILQQLASKFEHSNNWDIKKRIHGNLGNLRVKQHELGLARTHFNQAEQFAANEDDAQYQGLMAYNAARTLQLEQQWQRAITRFKAALPFHQHLNSMRSLTHYRLAQCYDQLNDKQTAKQHFRLIDEQVMGLAETEEFKQLMLSLAK